MNSISSRSHSKPHFFHYKKPYMVHFQTHKNPMEKTSYSLENSESNGSFLQNTLKSFLFDWDLFWPQSF